jgi:hypothetical protein
MKILYYFIVSFILIGCSKTNEEVVVNKNWILYAQSYKDKLKLFKASDSVLTWNLGHNHSFVSKSSITEHNYTGFWRIDNDKSLIITKNISTPEDFLRYNIVSTDNNTLSVSFANSTGDILIYIFKLSDDNHWLNLDIDEMNKINN